MPGVRGTQNPAAYQLYLKGRYFWNKRGGRAGGKLEAIESFEQAIQLDPNYAEAYAGLADCYNLLDAKLSPAERLAKALPAVTRALELNERLAEAHTSLGMLRFKLQSDWAGAETAFKRAIELNPNYATAWHWYGEFLSLQGRGEEALRTIQQAERLAPLSLPIKNDAGLTLLRLLRYDQGLAKFQEVVKLDPQFNRVRFGITLVYLLQGREPEAVNANMEDLRGKNTDPELLAELDQARQAAGEPGYWRKFLELKEAGKVSAGVRLLTLLRLRLGETERALTELEKVAEREGTEGRIQLKASPEFDPLRQQPRFQQLLQQAGFANR
jgi:tetratricopeptide (TPR) repeat protein